MKKYILLLTALLTLTLTLTACAQSAATSAATDAGTAPNVISTLGVVAEGRLVPRDTVQLSFVAAGQVTEILVKEGDTVKAGDVLARLGDREQYEAAVSRAELELSSATLEKISAEADLLAAQQVLQTIHDTWPDQATLAQEALKDARQRQYNAQRNLGYLTTTADQTDIDLAYTQMVLAKDALDKAQEDFAPYEDKPAENLVRANLQAKLAEAQKAYDAAVRNYNALTGTTNDFDLSQAEAELAIANAQLEQAQANYDQLITGPDPDEIALAEARISTAQERITTAEQRILTAQANLTAAQANLDNLDLVATIDGTIVTLDLIEGQQITPGTPVIQVADFSAWYVDTDNLTEIEVVKVTTGQTVRIVPDALPNLTLIGTVDSISDLFEEKRGDITYTASILLDEVDPRLRWGMTVVVTFDE
ncbi:MAG: efflux RND transporter periplasmic adaptor subunit [Anaerolineales bacterium]|nr:efflux RND transporter periplasmic adaptor subunit [Anaerolineales bacterium]